MGDKRPLGLTIILIYFILSLIFLLLTGLLVLSTVKTYTIYLFPLGRVEGILWFYYFRIVSFAVILSIIHGIWKRKGYTPYIIYLFGGYHILSNLSYLIFILFYPESYFSMVKSMVDISQDFLVIQKIISITGCIVKIAIPSLIIWYTHKHKSFFSKS